MRGNEKRQRFLQRTEVSKNVTGGEKKKKKEKINSGGSD